MAARAMHLVWPDPGYLPGYVDALERGWSPDNLRPQAGHEELARIRSDAVKFLEDQVDRQGRGKIMLPDGRVADRLPSFHLWMWDGEFCGSIGFRWQPGTTDLPPYCLGHIGYAVVPWKSGRGYATEALRQLLPYVRQEGLPFVELTTDSKNVASQKVIEKNGGELVERFFKPASHGGAESLRFRIHLDSKTPKNA